MKRLQRTAVLTAMLGVMLGAGASAAQAHSATSWGFVCNAANSWVRVNWPTIRPTTDARVAVYFRAFLDQRVGSTWQQVGSTTWYTGVSNRFGRYQLDQVLGATSALPNDLRVITSRLPYPFVGFFGHLFAYTTGHGSYAGPQLGPWWRISRHGFFRVREQYSTQGVTWSSSNTHVNPSNAPYCYA